MMNKVDEPNGMPGLNDISKSYQDDFVAEIREIVDEIELALVNLEMEPTNQTHLQDVFRNFHTIRGLTGLLEEQSSNRIAVASEDLLEVLRKYVTSVPPTAINMLLQSVQLIRKICDDVRIFADTRFAGEVDQHILGMQQTRADIQLEARQPLERETRIGEILIEEGAMGAQDVEDVLRRQSSQPARMKFGEIVLREKKVDATDIIKAIRMQKIRSSGVSDQYVRIPLDRLDQILGMVESINGIYGQLRDEAVLRFGSNDFFTQETGKAYHMLGDIKSILRVLRMVNLQTTFQKITRTVCSLIEERNLDVMFSTLGENIEMDKDVAERLIIPLAEIVRVIISICQLATPHEDERLRSIELVAYEEGEEVRLDVNADAKIPMLLFKKDASYNDLLARVAAMKGKMSLDDMGGEGFRVRITIAR